MKFMRSMFITFPLIIFILALVGLSAWIVLLFKPSRAGWSDKSQAALVFSQGTIIADVASSMIKQYRGLSGHAPLAENTGMLFVFGHPDTYPFVMRGMTFPLDFVWLSADRVVADVDENIPPPAPGENAEVVIPKEPITMVLEIPAGTVQRLNIKIGDSVTVTRR